MVSQAPLRVLVVDDSAYNRKNIADILTMSVDEAARFFRTVPAIYDRLFDTNNFIETGKWFEMRDAYDSGIRFNFMMASRDPITWVTEWSPGFYVPISRAQANSTGLTAQ